MREIKFRAWYADEMVQVGEMELFTDGTFNVNGELPISGTKLMQFTGLKDKNGKEIYEGDIVCDWEEIDTYKVVWNREWACFELERITHHNDTTQEIQSAQFDLLVIGNIYENPDLLKA